MSEESTKTLGDALPEEIERVKAIIDVYDTVPTGVYTAALMRADVTEAERAIREEDLAGMCRAYQALKEWKDV